jgi:hypothetical protein
MLSPLDINSRAVLETYAVLTTLELDSTKLNQAPALSFLIEHDLFGKPVSTFRIML